MKIWQVKIRDEVPPVGKMFDKGEKVIRSFSIIDMGDSNDEQFKRYLNTTYGMDRVVDYKETSD